jgi:hypothetical protein
MPDAYLETVNRMEPDITPVDLTSAAASIAISLRRIADALDAVKEELQIIRQYGMPDQQRR